MMPPNKEERRLTNGDIGATSSRFGGCCFDEHDLASDGGARGRYRDRDACAGALAGNEEEGIGALTVIEAVVDAGAYTGGSVEEVFVAGIGAERRGRNASAVSGLLLIYMMDSASGSTSAVPPTSVPSAPVGILQRLAEMACRERGEETRTVQEQV